MRQRVVIVGAGLLRVTLSKVTGAQNPQRLVRQAARGGVLTAGWPSR